MQIELMKTDDLIPYINNPRKNDMAVDAVASSIKNFGFKVPIVIDSKNEIITGHTRLKAAKKLGMEEVPIIRADDLTPAQVKAFRLADNKVAELAEWDDDLLKVELDGLDFDMTEFGFDEPQADHKSDEPYDDEYDPDDHTVEPKAKTGDIYKLGDHRLMCGDSTKAEDVAKLMDGAKADLFLTDPPYGVDYTSKSLWVMMNGLDHSTPETKRNRKSQTIENDVMDDENFLAFLKAAFSNAADSMKPGAAFYIWHADVRGEIFRRACRESIGEIRQCLIWAKNHMVFGRQDYQWKHEPCLYGWKPGAAHHFIDLHTETTTIADEPLDFSKMAKADMQSLLEKIFASPATTIEENIPRANDLHPTMKPIPLFGRLIQNSSRKGENVLDLFGGSGTTLIACEELSRSCYMMEYDPHYVDVIIDRWEQMTGQKAEKIN